MWVFLSNSFLSIVQHRDQPDHMLVRARLKDDINRVFPLASVTGMEEADYRYRAVIPRQEVAQAMALQVLKINYDNFKNTVTEPDRHSAYFGVWEEMHGLQYQQHKEREVSGFAPTYREPEAGEVDCIHACGSLCSNPNNADCPDSLPSGHDESVKCLRAPQ